MTSPVPNNSDLQTVWDGIIALLDPSRQKEVSAIKSRFHKNNDNLECELRRNDRSLIATCLSESDETGNRRWTVDLH